LKEVLIISFSDLATDPRVNRQIGLLARDYRVLAAGFANPQVEGVQYIAIPPSAPRTIPETALNAFLLKLGLYERYYWSQPRSSGASPLSRTFARR
jgi:hypothetical protein